MIQNIQTILNFSKKKKIKFFGNAAATAFPNVPCFESGKLEAIYIYIYIYKRYSQNGKHITPWKIANLNSIKALPLLTSIASEFLLRCQ
jgi:hypothetical protein